MKIQKEFLKFLMEIKRSYNLTDDDFGNLELRLFSEDELRQIGFYIKKIDDFIKSISPLELKDINEYFETHIEKLNHDFIDEFIFEFHGGTIGEFFKNLKLSFIKKYLSKLLYQYVKEIKNSLMPDRM